ncbi:MAG: hypothetical protein H6Q73_2249 [Firmicutes bacterium]|nr:hypothetical protein [Bacillota bacterium]
MREGKVRHLFPGGNTPQGFFSYYNYIIPVDANRIFILKGGPGTGKSTFMRKIGEAMISQGHDVEFHHCSSDNKSLDGLVIPDLQVAFIDGTAPHIVDPKNPGCVDEIIHLGDFWDEKGIVPHKKTIIDYNAEISRNFQRAYRLLNAAKSIYDDIAAINSSALDIAEANRVAEELIEKIFAGVNTRGAGKVRKLFASAITPDGPVNYLESSVWNQKSCYVINGNPGTGKSTIVQKVISMAVVRGLDVEVFYCPLDPMKPEHLVIPSLDVAVTTSNMPHVYNIVMKAAGTIEMNQYLNSTVIKKSEDAIAYDEEVFLELFIKSVACIKQSKELHDQLEAYYIPNMDFQAIQNLWQRTYERVAYIKGNIVQ